VGAYRKFIPNLGILPRPLNMLTTRSKHEFETHMAVPDNRVQISGAIETIKAIVIADPYLGLPRKDINSFIVRTHASDFGMGATPSPT
jgi:hypothetical protein